MRKMAVFAVLILLPCVTAVATLAPEPWLDEVKQQEPEIWRIIVGGMSSKPVPKVGERVDLFMESYRKAEQQYAAAIAPEKVERIADKLESACSPTPPNWPPAILCLQAAGYILPNERILKVAARIVEDPPKTGLGEPKDRVDEGVVRSAMWVLGKSGKEEYGELLLSKLNDSYFALLRERGMDPIVVGSRAALSYADVARKDKKRIARLEQAKQRVPEGEAGDNIRRSIDGQIQSIRETTKGAVYKQVALP